MTDSLDWPPILAAIEEGIKKAREDRADATEEYMAFVVLRELHRQKWSIVRTP